ncbi:STAS domain-containing protein [Nonomuraea sp. NPDC047897]|jgi:anti-anti-sigma regulatory factor|uniref:STAS domain-containing protein n=1 Tax=Nonomuraea sp. NPDC047897 TaxID=3364346 RepID=UPI00371E694F
MSRSEARRPRAADDGRRQPPGPERARPEHLLYADRVLRIARTVTPDSSVMRLVGEIDATNSRAMLTTLTRARHTDERLVLDLRDVTFADVSAVKALTVFTADGTIHVRDTPPQLARLMRLLHLPPFG